jgi:hypothetical protein
MSNETFDPSEPRQHGQSTRPTVFLAYPFRSRNTWIRYYVVPLLRLYGCNVDIGNFPGEIINDAVTRAISQSQLLVAFLTKSARLAKGRWISSEWVLQELGFARGRGIPVVVVRELGVTTDVGILGDIQVIPLDMRAPFLALAQLRSAVHRLVLKSEVSDQLEVRHLSRLGRTDLRRKQWWDFWTWIDGSEEALQSVARVTYRFPKGFIPQSETSLHPQSAFGNYSETDAPIKVRTTIFFDSKRHKTLNHQITLLR